MIKPECRSDFAQARLLPPLGEIARLVIRVFELDRPETYRMLAEESRRATLDACEKLQSRSAERIRGGESLVEEETHRVFLSDLVVCLHSAPELPFQWWPLARLDAYVKRWASFYEFLSNRLSNNPSAREPIQRAMIRQAVVELAVRIGAIDVVEHRNNPADEAPAWSGMRSFRKALRFWLDKLAGNRDIQAQGLGASRSKLDNIIAGKTIPDGGFLDQLARKVASSDESIRQNVVLLRRLCAGRRFWTMLEWPSFVTSAEKQDLLQAFQRICRRVVAYAEKSAHPNGSGEDGIWTRSAITANHPDPGLWSFLVKSETSIVWQAHLCAEMDGSVFRVAETYANAFAAFIQGSNVTGRKDSFDDSLALALKRLPEVAPFVERADAAERRGDFQEAIGWIERQLQENPSSPGCWQAHGRLQMRLGQPEKAEESFRFGLQFAPDSCDILCDLALSIRAQGDLQRAGQLLEAELERHGANPVFQFAFGAVLHEVGEHERAVVFLLKAAQAGFRIAQAYDLAGKSYSVLGRKQQATECERRAATAR